VVLFAAEYIRRAQMPSDRPANIAVAPNIVNATVIERGRSVQLARVSQLMKLRSNDFFSYLRLEADSRARPFNQAHALRENLWIA